MEDKFSYNQRGDILSKHLEIKNSRVYWNSMSETFIPTSLWEQTKDLEQRIFEAIAADDLFELMFEPFQTKSGKQYFSNKDELILPFNLNTKLVFVNTKGKKLLLKIDLNIDSLKIELNNKVINDMKNMLQFCDNFVLAHSIK